MKIFSSALVAVGLLASGAVAAKEAGRSGLPVNANQFEGVLLTSPGFAGAGNDRDHADFDHAGTRGRDDLGASPSFPEGPGNVTD